ncbi:MAG: GYD domain-containing protein [Promethearchaeota archaeon]
MPTFVILGNLTSEAIENLSEEGKRQQSAFELAKKYKCEVKALYYTMGKYDWVAIVDAPDNETAIKALFELAAGKATRTRTMLAFPAEDIAKMTAEL